MSDFVTGAGATFGLSAGTPATWNEAGYEALTYTTVGKITEFGDIPSRVYQEVTLNYLASAGTDVAKGSFDLGSQQITFALDGDDTGQALLDTATNSTSVYSIKLSHPTLGDIYAQALVMGGPKTWGNNDTPATQTVTIRYKIASATEVGVVAVAA